MRLKKIKFECPFDTHKFFIYRIINFQMLCIYKIYYVVTIYLISFNICSVESIQFGLLRAPN